MEYDKMKKAELIELLDKKYDLIAYQDTLLTELNETIKKLNAENERLKAKLTEKEERPNLGQMIREALKG